MNIREMSQEELQEEALIDLAFAVLEERRETLTYQELVAEISTLQGLPPDELKARLVQFYTDLNIDGRFLILGENRWGIREWYPVEQIEEESAPTVKARKKKAKKVVEEDEDEDLDVDDDELDDFDDFDDVDDDDDDDDDDEDDTVTVAADDPDVVADVEVLDFDDDDDEEVDEIEGLVVEDEDFEEEDDDDDTGEDDEEQQ